MNLWNIKNLEIPPITTYKAANRDVHIVRLKAILLEAISDIEQDNNLQLDLAQLSIWVSNMKTKLRNDKALKAVERLKKSLSQYLNLNIVQIFKILEDIVPKRYTDVTYLPSLNILHFILVRIQGIAKLLIRILELSKATALLLGDRISLGHMWKVAFHCYSVAAEIYSKAKNLLKVFVNAYELLLPFVKVLRNENFNWLPAEYNFPENLKVWLGEEWFKKTDFSLKPKSQPFMSFNSDSEVENDDLNLVVNLIEEEDIGEVVGSISTPLIKEEQKGVIPYNVNQIKTLKDLIEFQQECDKGNLPILTSLDQTQHKLLNVKLKRIVKKIKKQKKPDIVKELLRSARKTIESFL